MYTMLLLRPYSVLELRQRQQQTTVIHVDITFVARAMVMCIFS